MKPTNKRTLIIVALAIMEFLVMSIIIGSFVMGRISSTTFWTALIVTCLAMPPLAFLATRHITSGIKSPQEQAASAADDFNLDELIAPRTPESTIIEIISIALLIIAWYIILTSHSSYRDIRFLGTLTIAIIGLLVNAYIPDNSFLFGKLNNIKQVQISIRLRRILAVIFSIYATLYTCTCFNTTVLGYVFLGITALTIIVFRIIQDKAR
jgi:hypothetical protein